MKVARQNFKQILGKVGNMKEVKLFMQISASLLKKTLTLTQKFSENQGGLYASHVFFLSFFLKDDKHSDHLVWEEGGRLFEMTD